MLPMCGPHVAVWDLHPYVQCWPVTVGREAAPRFGLSFQHETVYKMSNVSASLNDAAILLLWSLGDSGPQCARLTAFSTRPPFPFGAALGCELRIRPTMPVRGIPEGSYPN